jgi:hypothetical protein
MFSFDPLRGLLFLAVANSFTPCCLALVSWPDDSGETVGNFFHFLSFDCLRFVVACLVSLR